jgi:hypothetical protein
MANSEIHFRNAQGNVDVETKINHLAHGLVELSREIESIKNKVNDIERHQMQRS